MKVIILAGGYGTRIRDVSENIPKPMIKIGPYPIIWYIMKHYSKFGFDDFVICLGYKGNTIKDFFLNYQALTRDFSIDFKSGDINFHTDHNESSWKVTLAETGLNTMTGGRISRIRKYINDEDFMLTYGDGLSDVNISQLLDFHKSNNKILTVSGVRPPGRFGEMVCNDDNQVIEFNEKPQASGGRINGGYFVAKSEIFNFLSDDENLIFEQEPMISLVKEKQLIMYKHDGFWQPMDTSREYKLLNSLYDSGNAPWI